MEFLFIKQCFSFCSACKLIIQIGIQTFSKWAIPQQKQYYWCELKKTFNRLLSNYFEVSARSTT